MKTKALTAERLREVLRYDPETGVFVWRETRNNWRQEGTIAGTILDGYRKIMIDRVYHCAHRLAWLYMTGEHPAQQIDHINLDRADNRFCNPAARNASAEQLQHTTQQQEPPVQGCPQDHGQQAMERAN